MAIKLRLQKGAHIHSFNFVFFSSRYFVVCIDVAFCFPSIFNWRIMFGLPSCVYVIYSWLQVKSCRTRQRYPAHSVHSAHCRLTTTILAGFHNCWRTYDSSRNLQLSLSNIKYTLRVYNGLVPFIPRWLIQIQLKYPWSQFYVTWKLLWQNGYSIAILIVSHVVMKMVVTKTCDKWFGIFIPIDFCVYLIKLIINNSGFISNLYFNCNLLAQLDDSGFTKQAFIVFVKRIILHCPLAY